MLCNPTDLWQQEHVAIAKHAHRVSNLANEDVDLIGMFDATWSVLRCSVKLMTFKFVLNRICFIGETSE